MLMIIHGCEKIQFDLNIYIINVFSCILCHAIIFVLKELVSGYFTLIYILNRFEKATVFTGKSVSLFVLKYTIVVVSLMRPVNVEISKIRIITKEYVA